jgi:cytochrome b subunit of formate dehydrogenase
MNNPTSGEESPSLEMIAELPENISFHRFDLSQRIEHIIFLTSFTILGITGLVQKFIDSSISLFIIQTLGGVENIRTVHHVAAFILMWVSIYHIIAVLYRVIVLRVPWSMAPLIDDFKHLFIDLAYYVGTRKSRAFYDRYSYAEKVEYLAVVWGTVIMAITGFMMWNPITTARYLPGEVIPAAKAAHGAEAVLAVLAILIWHLYHVHIKRFNKSMFTGRISHTEMEEEHPAELKRINSGEGWSRPSEKLIRRRQRAFIPIAIVVGFGLSAAVIGFISVEPATAIDTLPAGETAAIFVPITPTPRPTPQSTPTTPAEAQIGSPTWEGTFSALFRNRCGTCHVRTAVGGFNMSTYLGTLQGGASGPGIVPGKPEASYLIQIQSEGNHPGQLTEEELSAVIDWIEAGALER